VDEALDDLEALRELLLDLLRFRGAHLLLQFGDHGLHVGLAGHVADGLGAHLGDEGVVTVFVDGLRYSVSVRSCFSSSGVLPGSMTM
jgi:hypothetical protein